MSLILRSASILLTFALSALASLPTRAQSPDAAVPELKVPRCEDFEVTGDGKAEAWKRAEWVSLNARPGSEHDYATRFKVLYSATGIYVLFDGADKRLTATKTED